MEGSTEGNSPCRSPDRDVRVKTNVNPAHIRNSSMMNSQAQSSQQSLNEESKSPSKSSLNRVGSPGNKTLTSSRLKVAGLSVVANGQTSYVPDEKEFSPITRNKGLGVRTVGQGTNASGSYNFPEDTDR